MRRTEFKPKRKASKTDFHPATRAAIRRRSGGMCEAKVSEYCRRFAEHVHHVLRRPHCTQQDLSDGLDVCMVCHEWIHAHPAESERLGLLRRSGGLP